jgi:RNA polymerase sigma-70 factor (ECF subfamily)
MGSELNDISTVWSEVRLAHQGAPDICSQAQARLLERYETAIRRYLLGALRNRDAADEVYQNFAVRFLRGDFRHADPRRGRFRHLLKTALSHLINDYRRQVQKRPVSLKGVERVASSDEEDIQFHAIWRSQLIERCWMALAQDQSLSGRLHHDLLRLRMAFPDVKSEDLARRMATRLGRPVSADWVRKQMHRARRRLIALFVDEVAQTLVSPTFEGLEDELQALGMLDRCRGALQEWKSRHSQPG